MRPLAAPLAVLAAVAGLAAASITSGAPAQSSHAATTGGQSLAFAHGHTGVRLPRPPASVAPLTAGECTGLGGKLFDVDLAYFCPGRKGMGQLCVTVDKDGVVHSACVNEK